MRHFILALLMWGLQSLCIAQQTLVDTYGDQGVAVEHLTIIGGGHTWPGGTDGRTGTNFDIDASEDIWQFFSRYDIDGPIGGAVNIETREAQLSGTLTHVYPNPFSTQTTVCKEQQSTLGDKKYSIIIPDNYQRQGKSYPLVVCYKNQATDSLLQQYATDKQSIILQLERTTDTTLVADSLKAIIQKIIHEFTVARDKIYLLGINQNIRQTAALRELLNYYFAATAYITSDQPTYTLLKDSLKLYSSVKLYFFDAIDGNALDTAYQLFFQNYLWTASVNKISEDAVMLNFNKHNDEYQKNQLSLSYGVWRFNNSAKSREESLLEIPQSMGAWELSFARYLSKSLSVNINFGIIVKKIEPPRPDVFSVINGADIDVEGGGIFLMPISVGMDYYFLKQRFRPFAGFGVGIVPAKYTYIKASGNISNGINRNEFKFSSNAPFVELSSGFIYRTGKNVQFGLNCGYLQSKDFNENIGGYQAYNGLKISGIFSVVF